MAIKFFYVYVVYELLGQHKRLVYIGKGHRRGRYSRIDRYRKLNWVNNGSLGRRAKEIAGLGGRFLPIIIKNFGQDENAANRYEDYAIKKCLANPRLSILNDQTGGGSGRTFTVSTRLKLSAAHKGLRQSIEARRKLSDYWKGKPKSQAHCEAIRKAKLGVHRPDWVCEKMSKSMLGKKMPRRPTQISEAEFKALKLDGDYGASLVLTDELRRRLYAIRRGVKRGLLPNEVPVGKPRGAYTKSPIAPPTSATAPIEQITPVPQLGLQASLPLPVPVAPPVPPPPQFPGPNRLLYAIIGPSGVGKSWLCHQLADRALVLNFDKIHPGSARDAAILRATQQELPVLVELTVNVATELKRYSPWIKWVGFALIEPVEVIIARRNQRRAAHGASSKSYSSEKIARMVNKLSRLARANNFYVGSSSECLAKLQVSLSEHQVTLASDHSTYSIEPFEPRRSKYRLVAREPKQLEPAAIRPVKPPKTYRFWLTEPEWVAIHQQRGLIAPKYPTSSTRRTLELSLAEKTGLVDARQKAYAEKCSQQALQIA